MTTVPGTTMSDESALQGRRFVSAELMYKPRPVEPLARRVFDFTLISRLTELSQYKNSAVIYLCADEETIASLSHLPAKYPEIQSLFLIVNPAIQELSPRDSESRTPYTCGWEVPDQWQRYALTDRWARIRHALELSSTFTHNDYLIMPAHDAVWGRGLLDRLVRLSAVHATNGMPAAVSPYTSHQHSRIPGADIPQFAIDAVNVAFGRDLSLLWKISRGNYQSFWGKMGMIPFSMCADILRLADPRVWEDDLEIDRAIREAGFRVRAMWVQNANLYRQTLPVFDENGVRAVLDRTLHYSLNLPGQSLGDSSLLMRPLSLPLRLRRKIDTHYARALDLTERLARECLAAAADRIARTGVSWVDWGNYRYVVRVGDPFVQVWKKNDRV